MYEFTEVNFALSVITLRQKSPFFGIILKTGHFLCRLIFPNLFIMNSSLKIFVVEDDPWYGELIEYILLLNPDYEVLKFSNGTDCLNSLHQKPDVITLDYSLPDINGQEMLKKIKAELPDTPIIMISGQEDISTAINLLKDGAYDYIVKDDDTKDRLWNAIKNIKENFNLKKEISILKEEVEQKYNFNKTIIGNSYAINKIFFLLEKAAKTNITVSITGETGTGKEVVAKAIHYNSTRKKKPFVAVNVAAIPSELIESELFGHEKGAFTGAAVRRIGKFEEANGGTIFLDEIGEMDVNMQTKLLRVLQERELTRIGGNSSVKINVRVIVATHKNLMEEVKKGNFREDLYYRLLGLPIELPPLRERDNDALILAKHFVENFSKENGMKTIKLSEEAKSKILGYPFPGNVRELKAIVELAAVMSDGNEITSDDITFNSSSSLSNLLMKEITLREYTNQIIKHYLEKYGNDVLLVAKKLDIGKSTIYRMLKNQELQLSSGRTLNN